MSKNVHNGPIGKLFRTLGFMLLLVSGSLLLLSYLNQFTFLENYLTSINTIIDNDLSFIVPYTYLALIVGLIFLIWTQTNYVGIKIILSFTTLGTWLFYYQVDNNVFPEFLRFTWLNISFIDDLIFKYNWLTFSVLGVNSLFLYLLFGFKKPRRISGQFISSAMLLILVSLLVNFLPDLLKQSWTITATIAAGLFSLSYLTLVLGSIFGTLGFARK